MMYNVSVNHPKAHGEFMRSAAFAFLAILAGSFCATSFAQNSIDSHNGLPFVSSAVEGRDADGKDYFRYEPLSVQIGERLLSRGSGASRLCASESRRFASSKTMPIAEQSYAMPTVNVVRFPVPCEKGKSYEAMSDDEPVAVWGQEINTFKSSRVSREKIELLHETRTVFTGTSVRKTAEGCIEEKVAYRVIGSADPSEIGDASSVLHKVSCPHP